jgi:predicted nucleotidyltransferase
LKTKLSFLLPSLDEKYHVKSIEIFGSYVHGEQSEKSDLDLLIEFSQPYSLWELLDVKEFLSKKLRLKVDLVPKDSIKPMLKEQILQEAVPV